MLIAAREAESHRQSGFESNRQQAQFASEQRYQQLYTQAMARHHEVVSHESAHQAAAGAYGGPIHLDYQSLQVPMAGGGVRTIRYAAGGHVPVHMPAVQVDMANPTTARTQLQHFASAFKQIAAAALAPHSPSGADSGVAASAMARFASVQAQLSQLQRVSGSSAHRQGQEFIAGRRLNVVG
ncbi:MAG: putative metalloprotease CJM1_0395 family protein [Vampirovibrionales bacterium]